MSGGDPRGEKTLWGSIRKENEFFAGSGQYPKALVLHNKSNSATQSFFFSSLPTLAKEIGDGGRRNFLWFGGEVVPEDDSAVPGSLTS